MLNPAAPGAGPPRRVGSIWWFAFGYFACYVPYSALTKALSSGMFESWERVPGVELLPISTLASVVSMFAILTGMGWWRFAGRRQVGSFSFPSPGKWTLLSGLCTAAIIATTTLSYTFSGVSIVFVMLLMRGGVLIIAPIVDAFGGRRTRWFSWAGLALSMAALVVAFSEEGGYDITLLCAIDIAVYLLAYFIRLRLMTRLAKSDDPSTTLKYFVEEQLVGGPAIVLLIATWALLGSGELAESLRRGFTEVWDPGLVGLIALIGILSQGTGFFGGLILLDRGENTYTVPVNRSSSILAGVVASYSLYLGLSGSAPSVYELLGAALVVLAIVCLSVPPLLEKRRAKVRSPVA